MAAAVMKRWALRYAELGIPVIPLYSTTGKVCTCKLGRACSTPGKHPRIDGWQFLGSIDPRIVEGWWDRWPNANIGMTTGEPSGIDVADVDDRNGGYVTKNRLVNGHDLPPGPVVLSGSGKGEHIYLEHNPANAQRGFGTSVGIDFKGTGGQVVLPPSLHESGGRYEWKDGHDPKVPVPAWPDWFSLKKPGEAPRSAGPARPEDLERNLELAKSALDAIDNGANEEEPPKRSGAGLAYDVWVRMAYALKRGLGDAGFELFDTWSQESSKYDANATQKVWDTAKPERVGLGTVLWYATEEHGWEHPENDWKARFGFGTGRVEPDPETVANPLGWVEGFVLTDAEAEAIKSPDWAYEDLVVIGHVVVLVGEPGAGKTTIMVRCVCPALVEAGMRVFYVNADTSGGDAKEMLETAKQSGYMMLTPDLKGGSMADVVEQLGKMVAVPDADYHGTVFVFDTLKKMTDLISKRDSKELYRLLRALSGRGMTVLLLAHTNKYRDAEGNPVFEGTGDLRSDVDELIYLIPEKHADGTMTVSTDPDAPTAKKRGSHRPITFEIDVERHVTRADEYVDVGERVKARKDYESDSDIIEVIATALAASKVKQSEIVEYCKEHKLARNQVLRCLKRYSSKSHPFRQWEARRAMENNVIRYHTVEPNVRF